MFLKPKHFIFECRPNFGSFCPLPGQLRQSCFRLQTPPPIHKFLCTPLNPHNSFSPSFVSNLGYKFLRFFFLSLFFCVLLLSQPSLKITFFGYRNRLLFVNLLFFVHLFTIFISYFIPCLLRLFLFFYALLYFLITPPCHPISFSFPNISPSTLPTVFLSISAVLSHSSGVMISNTRLT